MNPAKVNSWSKASFSDLEAQLKRPDLYFFLRWPDKISGIVKDLPDPFPSPEGQAFNQVLEIRWKQRGDRYDLLWLGTLEASGGFEPIAGDWLYEDRNALVYPPTETRLPQAIQVSNTLDIGQRYFCDRRTGTIHFIALRIK